MELAHQQRGRYWIVTVHGRLDATWSNFFTETFLGYIRQGQHNLILEVSGLSFLSSAGIRSLLLIQRELTLVGGTLQMVHAAPFVTRTLEMAGFRSWLASGFPEDVPLGKETGGTKDESTGDHFILKPEAVCTFSVAPGWQPWHPLSEANLVKQVFPPRVFALGIGAPAGSASEALGQMGEFLAINGHVIFQPPGEKTHPDFLLAEQQYVPELFAAQSLYCVGEMSHLLRFSPEEEAESTSVYEITRRALEHTGTNGVALVILAEVDGLVGASLIRSPADLAEGAEGLDYPEVRSWLSFCGEKVHGGQLSLIFGIAMKEVPGNLEPFIRPIPVNPDLFGHFHAAVFPYQPLPNGKIGLQEQLRKILGGPPPLALMHLVEDNRPTAGLGTSTFVRGACWFAPIQHKEETPWD